MRESRIKEPLPASTNGKGVQVSFNKKRVLSSPSEALQRKGKHNHNASQTDDLLSTIN